MTLFGPPKHRRFLEPVSCGFAESFLRFCCEKVRMLRGSDFARSLLGKSIRPQFAGVGRALFLSRGSAPWRMDCQKLGVLSPIVSKKLTFVDLNS